MASRKSALRSENRQVVQVKWPYLLKKARNHFSGKPSSASSLKNGFLQQKHTIGNKNAKVGTAKASDSQISSEKRSGSTNNGFL